MITALPIWFMNYRAHVAGQDERETKVRWEKEEEGANEQKEGKEGEKGRKEEEINTRAPILLHTVQEMQW